MCSLPQPPPQSMSALLRFILCPCSYIYWLLGQWQHVDDGYGYSNIFNLKATRSEVPYSGFCFVLYSSSPFMYYYRSMYNLISLQIWIMINAICALPTILNPTPVWYQDDFKPVLRELLATHPGLEFLQSTPEFQERYGLFSTYNQLFPYTVLVFHFFSLVMIDAITLAWCKP